MTSIFNQTDIEAAAKAIYENDYGTGTPWKDAFGPVKSMCLSHAKAALNDALASAKARGAMTEGKHMALSEFGAGNTDLGSNEFWRGDFKFLIIRMEE